MAREPGCPGCCRWFLRNFTRWLSFLVAAGQITIWAFHFFGGTNIRQLENICSTNEAGYPTTVVDNETVTLSKEHKPFTCIGPSLAWLNEEAAVYDGAATYIDTLSACRAASGEDHSGCSHDNADDCAADLDDGTGGNQCKAAEGTEQSVCDDRVATANAGLTAEICTNNAVDALCAFTVVPPAACTWIDEEVDRKYGFKSHEGYLPCGPSENWGEINSGWFTADNCNRTWRETFTFRPQQFLDLWTPFFFGTFLALQHLSPDLRSSMISGNWTKMALYHVIMALWGCFGYAGNLGIVIGFSSVFAGFCGFVLGLIHEGGKHPITVIDLRTCLEIIPGCRKAPEAHVTHEELQEARVSINQKDKEIAALKAQLGGGTASE